MTFERLLKKSSFPFYFKKTYGTIKLIKNSNLDLQEAFNYKERAPKKNCNKPILQDNQIQDNNRVYQK